MSPQIFPLLLLGTLFVSIGTGAPIANQESSEDVKQADGSVDRAKRDQEQIVFGNQQNRARVVTKKSDLSNLDLTLDEVAGSPKAPLGELDQGAKVVVHEEKPVTEDLAERADAARKDFENEDKIADAMEAAMESVDKAEEEEEEEEEETSDDAGDQKDGATGEEDSSSSADIVEGSEESDDSTAEEGEASSGDEDADIRDLMQATSGVRAGEGEEGEQQTTGDKVANEVAGSADKNTLQSEQSEQESQGLSGEASEGNTESSEGNDDPDNRLLTEYYRQMYQYMMNVYPGGGQPLSGKTPYDYYRRRRSLARGKQGGPRRIKRDLLDDAEYDPSLARYLYGDDAGVAQFGSSSDRYSSPSSVLEMGDSLISDPDDYVPLTDADAEDLYQELEDYLEWELRRREGAQKLREILGLSTTSTRDSEEEQEEDGDTLLADDTGSFEDSDRGLLGLANPVYSLDQQYPEIGKSYYNTADKRARSGEHAFPVEAAPRKRYFFPFAEEPETHWGAFVPEKRDGVGEAGSRGSGYYLQDVFPSAIREEEYDIPSKRDYNEAIHRLQRLAMALSDNRGPYFNEVLQDQPYKK